MLGFDDVIPLILDLFLLGLLALNKNIELVCEPSYLIWQGFVFDRIQVGFEGRLEVG